MELYKGDPVSERCRKLNEVAQKIYKVAGLLAATAHLLDELAQSKDMDFDTVQICRLLLQDKSSVIEELEHKLDNVESICRGDYQNERPLYRWKN